MCASSISSLDDGQAGGFARFDKRQDALGPQPLGKNTGLVRGLYAPPRKKFAPPCLTSFAILTMWSSPSTLQAPGHDGDGARARRP